MPHKRNPAGCAVALAAATRLPGLVAAFLTGMVQEHERAVGGWHAEWPTIAAAMQTTGSALAAMADAAGGLSVDVRPDARQHRTYQRRHLRGTRDDAVDTRASARRPRRRFVIEALAQSRESGKSLPRSACRHARRHARDPRGPLRTIDVPEDYLGAAEALRARLLNR